MKKLLRPKYIFWTVFITIIVLVQVNAILGHVIYFDGAWYPPLSENWLICDVIIAIPLMVFIFYNKNTAFRAWSDKILSHFPKSKMKLFLSLSKLKFYFTLGLIVASFCLGWAIAIIKSSEYEDYLSIFFYLLAPEVAMFQVLSADWVDIVFIFSTIGIMLAKWVVFYLVAAAWFYTRPTSNIGAER